VTISGEAKKFTDPLAFHTAWCNHESLLVFKLPSFRALKFRLNDVKIALYQLHDPLLRPYLSATPMKGWTA
jgi:hypothetical protein